MTKITLLALTLLIGFNEANSQKPFLIKSAKIDFVFSNGFQKGTKTIIFKDSGNTYLEEAVTYIDTSLMFGNTPDSFPDSILAAFKKTAKSHLRMIQKRDSTFYINLQDSTENSAQRFYTYGNSIIPLGSKKMGLDTFLSKTCEVFELNGLKLWYWKGLILKKEIIIMPQQIKIFDTAVSIDENYIPAKDAFDIPDGITMKH